MPTVKQHPGQRQEGGDEARTNAHHPEELLLEVRDLKTEFHTETGIVHAVNGVSLQISKNEALGVVGESGSGKTVTALSIMRLIDPPAGNIVAGKVIFEGVDLLKVSEEDMRHVRGGRIAMIFQDPMASLNPVLSIERQMTEALEEHLNQSRRAARRRAIELLDLVGVADAKRRIHDYPHQFSGGMRQRVMIGVALSCNPRLLIADEPTTALDVTIQAQIIDLVNKLRREFGMAIMWISHDLGVVAGLCDRINVMYAGHIVETGPVEVVYARPRHPYTIGLLQSIPPLVGARTLRLIAITGSPPTMTQVPAGCPFRDRCAFAVEQCDTQRPPLIDVGLEHQAACWVAPDVAVHQTSRLDEGAAVQ